MKFEAIETIDKNGVHTNHFELFEILEDDKKKKMGTIYHQSNANKIIKLLNRRWGNSQ